MKHTWIIFAFLALSISAAPYRVYLPIVVTADQPMIDLINELRTEAGCKNVTPDVRLTAAATRHAADLDRAGVLSHIGSDGSTLDVRLRDSGYRVTVGAGEALAMSASPQAAVRAWEGSSAHRGILTECHYHFIGEAAQNGVYVVVVAT